LLRTERTLRILWLAIALAALALLARPVFAEEITTDWPVVCALTIDPFPEAGETARRLRCPAHSREGEVRLRGECSPASVSPASLPSRGPST
jgi:hypothetical protein